MVVQGCAHALVQAHLLGHFWGGLLTVGSCGQNRKQSGFCWAPVQYNTDVKASTPNTSHNQQETSWGAPVGCKAPILYWVLACAGKLESSSITKALDPALSTKIKDMVFVEVPVCVDNSEGNEQQQAQLPGAA
eukprot:scaffold101550_cov22-Tisochrysis_lutea.AAC.1